MVTTSRERTPEVVKTLCTHPIVRKISFTGSTAVGKVSRCIYFHRLGTLSFAVMKAFYPMHHWWVYVLESNYMSAEK